MHGGAGAGTGLEAHILLLLPVPAGHSALHGGALGADGLQFHVGFSCGVALYIGYVFMPQHIVAILHHFEMYNDQDMIRIKMFLGEDPPYKVGMRPYQMS